MKMWIGMEKYEGIVSLSNTHKVLSFGKLQAMALFFLSVAAAKADIILDI